MCGNWEFTCGHLRETLCPAYKNRLLRDEGKESTLGDDDPFTDAAGALPKTVKERRSRADSDVTVNRPPQFTLPSPTTASSVTSDSADVRSSTGSLRHSVASATGAAGPSSTRHEIGGSSSPGLSVRSDDKIEECKGPRPDKEKIPYPCYDCMLLKAKGNSAFQQDERAAEARLYDEVGRPGNSTGAVAGGREGTATGSGGDTGENPENSLRYTRGNPAYVNNAIDVGRGNPPNRSRRGSSAPANNSRGRYQDGQATPRRAPLVPLYPQSESYPAYFSYPERQTGYGNVQGNVNPNATNFNYQPQHFEGRPQDPYGFQNFETANVNYYPQEYLQPTPYHYAFEPYGAPPHNPYGDPTYYHPQVFTQMPMRDRMDIGMELASGYPYHQAAMQFEQEGGAFMEGFDHPQITRFEQPMSQTEMLNLHQGRGHGQQQTQEHGQGQGQEHGQGQSQGQSQSQAHGHGPEQSGYAPNLYYGEL